MSQALSIITQSRRPAQKFRVGYDMPARQLDTAAAVLEHSRAVYYRMHTVTPRVVPPAPPEPAKVREPHAFLDLHTIKRRERTFRWKLQKHEQILHDAAIGYGVTVAEIKGQRRSKKIVEARHYAFFRMVAELGYSLPMVGKVCGDRDHTTVLHGIRRYEALARGEVYKRPRYAPAKEAAAV